MILIKSFSAGVSYDRFKHIYANLNERNKVLECYIRLKLMTQGHLQVFCKAFTTYAILLINETVVIKDNF